MCSLKSLPPRPPQNDLQNEPQKVPSWIQPRDHGLLLKLYIQPGAKKTTTAGLFGEPPRLKLRIAAPPVDGAANEAVLAWVRSVTDLPLKHIELLRGHTSRQKDILLTVSAPELNRVLALLLQIQADSD